MNYRQIRYKRAASTYHSFSGVQKEMALDLLSLFPEEVKPRTILELGCGTGHLSQMLLRKFPQANFILTDISGEMLDQCQSHLPIGSFNGSVRWERADAEHTLPFNNISLTCSNSLIQWMPDPEQHFNCVANCMPKGGYYLFSSFKEDNFPELQRFLKEPPFNLTQFPGHTKETLFHALERAGLPTVRYREADKSKYFQSFERFLRTLKNTGASGRKDFIMTRSKLKQLSEQYTRSNKLGEGILTTWKMIYVLAEKK